MIVLGLTKQVLGVNKKEKVYNYAMCLFQCPFKKGSKYDL